MDNIVSTRGVHAPHYLRSRFRVLPRRPVFSSRGLVYSRRSAVCCIEGSGSSAGVDTATPLVTHRPHGFFVAGAVGTFGVLGLGQVEAVRLIDLGPEAVVDVVGSLVAGL